jgi:hypothetical protein
MNCQTPEMILNANFTQRYYLIQILVNFLIAIAPQGTTIKAGNAKKPKERALRKFGRQTFMPGYHSQIAYLIRLVADTPDRKTTRNENTNPEKGLSAYWGSNLMNMNSTKPSAVI